MHENDGMLAPYRVLDLTSETGQPCGKLLADLGADVIKVEPPGGDPARRRPPFVDDDPDPEKGLYWLAYNANKRGVVLDLESPAGRARFERLATTADVVLESSAPGEMDRLGLSYERLAELNPGLVLVSITPFGQDGPYAHLQRARHRHLGDERPDVGRGAAGVPARPPQRRRPVALQRVRRRRHRRPAGARAAARDGPRPARRRSNPRRRRPYDLSDQALSDLRRPMAGPTQIAG